MILKSNAKVFLWVYLLCLIISGTGFGDNLKFKRETLIETGPWTAPFYLPLKLGDYYYCFNNPIGELPFPQNMINLSYQGLAPSVDYFWALNSGNLVFFNRTKKIVFVLDIQKKKWKEYYPCNDMVKNLYNLWVGPNDEIYMNIGVSDKNINNGSVHNEIRKYSLSKSRFAANSEFMPIQIACYAPDMTVSPTDNLFISEMTYMTTRPNTGCELYNGKGAKLGRTAAQGNTVDGKMFNFRKTNPGESDILSILNFDQKGLFSKRVGEATYGRLHFKATIDSMIIIYGHRDREISPINMTVANVNSPFLLVFDPTSETITEIDLYQDLDTSYIYYSVSDISINYKGEIYAIFVYFNTPGKIIGNEKIVLYRWKRN